MKPLNRNIVNSPPPYPIKILQFGGGNFLRAFVDWMIDVYNEKTNAELGILIISLMGKDKYKQWQDQEGLYHILTRGYLEGKIIREEYLVKSVSQIMHLYNRWNNYISTAENRDIRFIISNTTEAGIRFSQEDKRIDIPPKEFPAKLTLWLYHRYIFFRGELRAGCIHIPVELINNNGDKLRKCILQNADNWNLEKGFKEWVIEYNIFCNTLVDRIVTGINTEVRSEEMKKIGFCDFMMTQGEPYYLWAIKGPPQVKKELPLDSAGLNVIFTNDLSSFRIRKVRILNGAHTCMVPIGYLYGVKTVKLAVEHQTIGKYIQKLIFDEIITALDLPVNESIHFANNVLDRFRNPFLNHHLTSISLNSVSKFKIRVLPSIIQYIDKNRETPSLLVFSMAALICFYKGEFAGEAIPLNDDARIIGFFKKSWDECDGSDTQLAELSEKVLMCKFLWDQDLTQVPGIMDKIIDYLIRINNKGLKMALKEILQ